MVTAFLAAQCIRTWNSSVYGVVLLQLVNTFFMDRISNSFPEQPLALVAKWENETRIRTHPKDVGHRAGPQGRQCDLNHLMMLIS
jgi:hypothetical protein